jgi:phage shock protein PspC (stress-responsive transcriptional regulator)
MESDAGRGQDGNMNSHPDPAADGGTGEAGTPQEPPAPANDAGTGESADAAAGAAPHTAQDGPHAGYHLPPQPGNAGYQVPPQTGSGQRSFFEWVRSLGLVRGPDRWVGGVASGVAHRWDIDPILVRGLFVLLFFLGGIGVLLYGVAWALLPEPDGRIHVQEAGRGVWTAGMTGALVVTIIGLFNPAFSVFGYDGNPFGGFLWAVLWIGLVVGFVMWLVNRNRNDAGSPRMQYSAPNGEPMNQQPTGAPVPGPVPGPEHGPGHPGMHRSEAVTQPIYPSRQAGSYPPRAAAQGTYPPGPYSQGPNSPGPMPPGPVPPGLFPPGGQRAAAQRPARPVRYTPGPTGAQVALITGSALLVGAGLMALHVGNVLSLGGFPIAVALAAAMVVLGIGIVILGARGRGAGIISFFAVAAVVMSVLYGAGVATVNSVMANSTTWRPSITDPASEGYTVAAGRGTLDLSYLGQAEPAGRTVVPVQVAAGNMTIVVPDNVPVEVRSQLAFSSVEAVGLNGAADQDFGPEQRRNFTLNDDASGNRIVLDIRGAFSSVTITTDISEVE